MCTSRSFSAGGALASSSAVRAERLVPASTSAQPACRTQRRFSRVLAGESVISSEQRDALRLDLELEQRAVARRDLDPGLFAVLRDQARRGHELVARAFEHEHLRRDEDMA